MRFSAIDVVETYIEQIPRLPAIYRARWNLEYLIDLSLREGSFINEFRVGPYEFNVLHELL